MLYPQENKIRGIIDLNGVWDFAFGTTEEPKDTVTMRITGEILQCLLITRDRDWCFALTQ